MVLTGVLFLQACGDDDKPNTELEKLPAATQEGKGTLGCLIDSKSFRIKSSVDVESFYQEGVLSIGASTDDYCIGITIRDISLLTGVYPLDGTIDNFAELGDVVNSCLYTTTQSYKGSVEFTLIDQANFIISGTFEFTRILMIAANQ